MGQGRLTSSDHSKEWPRRLREASQKLPRDMEAWQPIVIEMGRVGAAAKLDGVLENYLVFRIIDNYDEQYAELIVSHHPQLYRASTEVKRESLKDFISDHYSGRKSGSLGSWVYYPWNGTLVHVLEKELFLESRTIRNKNLLTEEEQEMYANFSVGCAGMSVGSNVALALALTGGSQRLKIADGAVISASNLNRIFAGVGNIGESKSVVMARKMYEMNPYMAIERYDENITEGSIHRFFEKPWPLQAVVDEIDDLRTKILLRVEARKRRIPVIMVSDIGDDVMLDVERFDLDGNLPLFHGLVKDVESLLTKEVGKQDWLKYAMQIIDPANVSLRMQESLLDVGTKIVTQPQLGGTAVMSGVVAAYALKQIALGQKIRSGRTMISLEKHLREDINSRSYRRELRMHTKQLQKALDAM
jgi:tRNA threonylcarbamoyladenosine dehydratase